MSNTVTRYKFYAAWEYQKEENDLNEASKKGLQLVKGGCFHSKFRCDNSVRYIYQIDYNTKIDDKIRYKEAFEDQGWEYINSTYNGWHYFRKGYKEGMCEEDCKIYTDKQSLNEMHKRWRSLITFFTVIYGVASVYYFTVGIQRRLTEYLIEGFIFLMLMLSFLSGVINEKRIDNGKKAMFEVPLRIVFPISIILLFIILIIQIL